MLRTVTCALALTLISTSALAAKKKSPPAEPKDAPKEQTTEVHEPPPPPDREPDHVVPPPKNVAVSESPSSEVVVAPHEKKEPAKIDRIGVSLDLFAEASRMSGEQWINNFRSDESFDYSAGPLAASVYALFHPSEHVRVGPSVRFLGNYGAGGQFGGFGYLTEALVLGEYALHAFEEVEIVFGGRLGASILFPGQDFATEIRRLQDQGASVWSVPRIGWVGGLNAGLRRKIAGSVYARLDFAGQLGHQWLFATDQIVDGLRFRKYWGNDIRRLGANLGVEVAF